MVELFPTRTRYTAMSTSYTIASVAGGSVAPLIGTILVESTGAAITVAVYAAAVAVPALVSVYFSRESRGIDFFSAEGIGPRDGGPAAQHRDAVPLAGKAPA